MDAGQSFWCYGSQAGCIPPGTLKKVKVNISRHTKPTKKLGHKDISDSGCFLIRECICLRSFTNKNSPSQLFLLVNKLFYLDLPQDIDGNTPWALSHIVQLQQRSLFHTRTFPSSTEVTHLAHLFNVTVTMNPVKLFVDFRYNLGNS